MCLISIKIEGINNDSTISPSAITIVIIIIKWDFCDRFKNISNISNKIFDRFIGKFSFIAHKIDFNLMSYKMVRVNAGFLLFFFFCESGMLSVVWQNFYDAWNMCSYQVINWHPRNDLWQCLCICWRSGFFGCCIFLSIIFVLSSDIFYDEHFLVSGCPACLHFLLHLCPVVCVALFFSHFRFCFKKMFENPSSICCELELLQLTTTDFMWKKLWWNKWHFYTLR